MTISVYDSIEAKPIELHLAALGCNCQRFTLESVKELSHQYVDIVYIVPLPVLQSSKWAALRVRLAQSNRYYIVVGDGAETSNIVMAVRDGAHDFVQRNDIDERWVSSINRIVESQQLWLQLYGGVPRKGKELLLGDSTAMRALRQSIERLGPTNATVLVSGESGVGKELVASSLHKTTDSGRFIAVNCAAIPKDLIEAELFGAEKGAYTGSIKAREGLVEQANGGTLFLDEIGEMDLGLQPKILRFLETRQARRVGGNNEYRVNVRVISATNQNLEQLIANGQFRADLFYRLSEIAIHVPPLRVRPDDIPTYALAFVRAAGERFGKNFESLEPQLVRLFQGYEWPGNVRELKNAIERMVILYDGPVLRAGWWEVPKPSAFQFQANQNPRAGSSPGQPNFQGQPMANGGQYSPPMSRKQKIELAQKLIAEGGHDLTWIAAQVGVNSSTLYRWRKSTNVDE